MSYSAFVKINESGFNKILSHFKKQRPSTFNYGTDYFHFNPINFCEFDEDFSSTPYSTKLEAISFPGIKDKLQFSFQIRDIKFDFHPKSIVNNEVDIPNQTLQFCFRICLGIQFENLEKFCSCFSVITNGRFIRTIESGTEFLFPNIDLITIPEIKPDHLKIIFEKIITQTVNNELLKQVKTSVESLSFELGNEYDFKLALASNLPNPSISDDSISISLIIKN